MPQTPEWKRVLETGMQFTELRRSQAHRLASDLVAQGQLARDQIGAAVDELIEISRRRSEELRAIVRTEVQRQLGALGLATKRDLEALERRLRARTGAGKAPAKKAPAKKAPRKAAKKQPARAAAKKTSASASTAKRVVKRTAATRTVRKTATRRTAVRRTPRRPGAQRAR